MCIYNSSGIKRRESDFHLDDDYSLIGFAAYRINSACHPGSPLWCARLTRESLANIADRFMKFYADSPDIAERLQPPVTVVRDGDSDIVTGSEDTMCRYLRSRDGNTLEDYTLLPIRFGEMMIGMYLSGAYSLDQEAYNRFYPLALKHGYGIEPNDFDVSTGGSLAVIRVEFGNE